MTQPVARRTLLMGILAASAPRWATAGAVGITQQLASLEVEAGGRLGVCALDVASGRSFGVREHERFALCSTFKLLLAAAVLRRSDQGQLDLQRTISFGAADMLSHAPVTSARLKEGSMSVRDLCAAAVEMSDNPAANLLLNQIEGPAGLTRALRSMGDATTRLDRNEMSLNTNLRGDERDTTTPHAMAHIVARILTGDVLSAQSRHLLIGWLKASPTGARRIRAGLPADWEAGDKTGTGANGAVNDVAIFWPPGRSPKSPGSPWVLAIYMSESTRPTAELEPFHAGVAGRVAAAVKDAGPW